VPLLNTARVLSAPLGTVSGVFAVAKVHKTCLDLQGTYYGFGTAILVGLIVSQIFAVATDAIIHKKSAQVAWVSGTVVAFVIGIYSAWWHGVLAGVAVGSIFGSVQEHFLLRAVRAETVLMVPGDAEPYRPTNRTDGTTLFPGQPLKDINGDDALPTLVTATPRSSDSSSMKAIGNDMGQTQDSWMSPDGFGQTQSSWSVPNEQYCTMRAGKGQKRFGLKKSNSPSQTKQSSGMPWMSASPQSPQASPSAIAMAQGWAPSSPAPQRSTSSPPGGMNGSARRSGSARGPAQGGLPRSPGSGRNQPRQIASVNRPAAGS